MIFIADIITLLDQCFAKWSICALYYRIFSVNKVYALWIKGIAAVQFILYIMLVILQFLQCRPLKKFWQWWTPGNCIPFSTLLLVIEPLNSLIDFALVILAMSMIRSLRIKTQAKWKLRFLFGLGGLSVHTFTPYTNFRRPLQLPKLTRCRAGVFGFIKIGLAYRPDQQCKWLPSGDACPLLSVIQQAMSPILRQSRYLHIYRPLGGSTVGDLHCVLLCTDL